MSADPIVYCLEQVTDYRQFERLATDLMSSTDYPNIEPLGGSADGGRDALHVDKSNGKVTMFAYSVRADWKRKIMEDCQRLVEGEHSVDAFVFVTSRNLSVTEKDKIKNEINGNYQWDFEIYDIERIRTLLVGPLNFLVEKHPTLFSPPFFERRGGQLIGHKQPDLVVIDHFSIDHAFGSWLTKRLSSSGYLIWCSGLAPLVGENSHTTITSLIQSRAAMYIPVLSQTSAQDLDLRSRITIAATNNVGTVPCWMEDLSSSPFDTNLRSLEPARFDLGWAQAMSVLARQFEERGVTRPLDLETGRQIALDAYQAEPLVVQQPERLYSNIFSVHVPNAIQVHEFKPNVAEFDEKLELERRWAHVIRDRFVFSFASPPKDLPLNFVSTYAWDVHRKKMGVFSSDLVKMLVKRSLFVVCYRVGFHWCSERNTLYLNEKDPARHRFQDIDGRITHVKLNGERSVWRPTQSLRFRYQLGPVFRVGIAEDNEVTVRVGFYVRVTDLDGAPLDAKVINARRKVVTKSWWNRQWLQRTLCMTQLLAGDANLARRIIVGEGSESVEVDTTPHSWDCPVALDVLALDRVGDFQDEIAEVREVEGVEGERVDMKMEGTDE